MLDKSQAQKVMDEVLAGDGERVHLVCGIHKHVYGSKKPDGTPKAPHFGCKQCMFVEYMGLLVNTPADKRQETVEMLEYSAHKMIEAAKDGRIDKLKLFKHPKVYVNDRRIN